jgi:hypothetical protein
VQRANPILLDNPHLMGYGELLMAGCAYLFWNPGCPVPAILIRRIMALNIILQRALRLFDSRSIKL